MICLVFHAVGDTMLTPDPFEGFSLLAHAFDVQSRPHGLLGSGLSHRFNSSIKSLELRVPTVLDWRGIFGEFQDGPIRISNQLSSLRWSYRNTMPLSDFLNVVPDVVAAPPKNRHNLASVMYRYKYTALLHANHTSGVYSTHR